MLAAGVDESLRAIGGRLLAVAREQAAYGLAAAHIGDVAPVIVVSDDGRTHRLLYNPRIVAMADETDGDEEGSVSLPGLQVEIRRPVWADVAYMDETGAGQTERFVGFAGRVVQHEIDQMQGIFFIERLSRLKRDMLLRKLRKLPG